MNKNCIANDCFNVIVVHMTHHLNGNTLNTIKPTLKKRSVSHTVSLIHWCFQGTHPHRENESKVYSYECMASLCHTSGRGWTDLLWWGLPGSDQVKWKGRGDRQRREDEVGGYGVRARKCQAELSYSSGCVFTAIHGQYMKASTYTVQGQKHTECHWMECDKHTHTHTFPHWRSVKKPPHPSSCCTPSSALLSEKWGRLGRRGVKWGMGEWRTREGKKGTLKLFRNLYHRWLHLCVMCVYSLNCVRSVRDRIVHLVP